jgi:asparagine synthase (glutamine-hydrolysing)
MNILPAQASVLARVDFAHAPKLAVSNEVRLESDEDGRTMLLAPGIRVAFSPRCWHLARHTSRIALASLADTTLPGGALEPEPAAKCLRLQDSLGELFPAHLSTPFAVAIIDLALRAVYLATDRFSIRPLCAGVQDRTVVFSDRADAAARALGAPIDRQALFDYVVAHVIRAPRTLFLGVERVEAGHALELGPGRHREIRYWHPRFEERKRPEFALLRQEFLHAVRNAVEREACRGQVGAFLSGGTDSSTLVGMLSALGLTPRAYSIGFDAPGYDEMQYARIAARHFGAQHREHYITTEEVAEGIPQLAQHFDQPFGNSSALPALCCARLAREDGISHLLAGDGGDELFGGNTRYARQKLFEPYVHLPQALRARVVEPWLTGVSWAPSLPGVRKLASYVRQARVPMPERLSAASLFSVLGAEQVFEHDFLHGIDIRAPARLERAVYRRTAAQALVNRMLAFDWKFTLADNDLPKVLGAAGLAGLTVGFPFLDDAVVDLSLRVPPQWKVRGFTLRWFFKQSLHGFLPDAVLEKKKHGFGMPFGPWLISNRRLRELSGDLFSRLGGRGWVRPEFLDLLLHRKLPEHPAFYGEMVWILVMLEQWLQLRERHAESVPEAA